MSMNYAFGFSLFLLILVGLNIYFFYTLNTVGKKGPIFNVPSIKLNLSPSVYKDIYEYLNYLPSHYKQRNPKFISMQRSLIQTFNSTSQTSSSHNVLFYADNVSCTFMCSFFACVYHHMCLSTNLFSQWNSEDSLFPHRNGAPGQLLHAIRTSQIVLVDNAPRGTQLKLLLLLEVIFFVYYIFLH